MLKLPRVFDGFFALPNMHVADAFRNNHCTKCCHGQSRRLLCAVFGSIFHSAFTRDSSDDCDYWQPQRYHEKQRDNRQQDPVDNYQF